VDHASRRAWSDRAVAGAVFAALSALYWFLRCPTFGPGDSPQHVLSAVVWGVSWPPGYPLYVMLGHAASLLPGAAAANVDGLSGLLHAGASAAFYLVLRRMSLKGTPALIATALLSLSPLFWYYSEIAEVRALNDFLALAAAYLAVAWSRDGRTRQGVALAAVLGFGTSHHPTFVLIFPALACWLWMRRSFPADRRLFGYAAVFAACAVLPYLVLGLRLKYGAPAYNLTGASTFADARDLFLRKDLGGALRMVAGRGLTGPGGFDPSALREHLGWFLRSAVDQLTPFGWGLTALGAAWAYRRRRAALVFWCAWLVAAGLVFVLFSSQQLRLHDEEFARAVTARFYLLPFIGAFALAGFGAQWLLDRLPAWAGRAALAAAVVLPLALRPIDLRRRNFTMDYAREILRGTGPSDMLVVDTDASNFALLYLDVVEHATGDRALLIPSLFSYPPYRAWLSRRVPTLVVPPDAGILMWSEWRRLNPSRGLYAEAEWKDRLAAEFPGSAPSGVMIRISDFPPSREVSAEEARFLAGSPVIGAVTRRTVYPFSMDADLLHAYRILLESAAPGDAGVAAAIRARLTALR
jgi:MYXO-CTERM domain-containing protein